MNKWPIGLASFLLGLAYWFLMVTEVNSGNPLVPPAIGWTLLLVTPLGLGFLSPRTPTGLIGGALILGPIVVAWWTAPRGDGDGLWVLVYLYLFILGIVADVLARFGRKVRLRSSGPQSD